MRWIAALVALYGLASPPAMAAGDGPTVNDLSVQRAPDGSRWVRFEADNLLDAEARDAIESGVAATVHVTWEIERPRALWWNETLERERVSRVLSYDNLTKRYRLDTTVPGGTVRETDSLAEAERWLGSVEAPVHADLEGPGEKLLRVRLACDSRDGVLPLGLERALFFLPGWGFDTGWVSLTLP